MKLTTDPHLLSTLRKNAAVPSLPHTHLWRPQGQVYGGNDFALLKLSVEAFGLKLPTFLIGYRHLGTTYQSHIQNRGLDPLKMGPIDSPVSPATNYQPTLSVWHPHCAVRIRNEGNMTLQHTATHRLQVYNSPLLLYF